MARLARKGFRVNRLRRDKMAYARRSSDAEGYLPGAIRWRLKQRCW